LSVFCPRNGGLSDSSVREANRLPRAISIERCAPPIRDERSFSTLVVDEECELADPNLDGPAALALVREGEDGRHLLALLLLVAIQQRTALHSSGDLSQTEPVSAHLKG
jgi:hypothetical protein